VVRSVRDGRRPLLARRGCRFPNRCKSPTELGQHLEEVGTQPLVDDLAFFVELECQHERSLHGSSGRLVDEQPWSLVSPRDVVEDNDHVAFGDDPLHSRSKVREGGEEPSTGSQHRWVGREFL